jgi:metallo-beta-lactamase class B
MAPRRAIPLLGGTWLAGSLHLNTAVIDTGAGLIVVDAGLPQSVAPLEAQIRSTGHRVSDVRYILVTEAHFDHAGGVAALARDSGAVVVGSPYTIGALAQGRTGPKTSRPPICRPSPRPAAFAPLPMAAR